MDVVFPFPAVKTKIIFGVSSKKILSEISRDKNCSLLLDKNLSSLLSGAQKKNAFLLPPGETCKNWQTLGDVLAWLAHKKAERNSTLYVVGGGAACDLGALAAALYRRGMPLVLVPTTLLSQIDAAVGGKCAVDFLEKNAIVKNFAGVFYPAQKVYMAFDFFETLPLRERRSGLGELLKIFYLEGLFPRLAPMQQFLKSGIANSAMRNQVKEAIAAKAKYVQRDPLDTKRIRESLNFGHTVGHAMESMANGSMSHGEAIALGLFFEVAFAERKSGLKFAQRIYGDLLQLNFTLPALKKTPSESDWEFYFRADKKMENKKIAMSIAAKPGKIRKLLVDPKELAEFMAGAFPALVQLGKAHPQV